MQEQSLLPRALRSWPLVGGELQPRAPPSRLVARICLCVLCPRREAICHHYLIKLATPSPETLQASLASTCVPAW